MNRFRQQAAAGYGWLEGAVTGQRTQLAYGAACLSQETKYLRLPDYCPVVEKLPQAPSARYRFVPTRLPVQRGRQSRSRKRKRGPHHRRHNRRNDDFAGLISLLRSEGAREPTATCHYGFLCNGPQCSGPQKDAFYRWLKCRDVEPGAWICGTRFECSECEDFNLCSGCNDILIAQRKASIDQGKPPSVSSPSSSLSSDDSGSSKEVDRSKMQYEAHHKTKGFDTRQEPDTSIAYCKDGDAYRKAYAMGVEKLELGVLWTG